MTTYLIYSDIKADRKVLKVATQEEWTEIMCSNRGLPIATRRFFIKDTIVEKESVDQMFIEVSLEGYRKWHSEHISSEKKRKYKMKYKMISLSSLEHDDCVAPMNSVSLEDTSIESAVIGELLMEQVKTKLSQWKPWAVELFNCLYDGEEKEVVQAFIGKHAITERAFRYRKTELRKVVKNFLQK